MPAALVANVTQSPYPAAANCAVTRVIPMGDSITQGYPNSAADSYRARLAESLNEARAAYDMVGFHRNTTIGPHPPDGGVQWGTNWQNYRDSLDMDFEGKNGYQAGRPTGSDLSKLMVRPQVRPGARLAAYLPSTVDGARFTVRIPISAFAAGTFADMSLINFFNESSSPMQFDISRIAFTSGSSTATLWVSGSPVAFDQGSMTVTLR